ncbi:Decaprenyl diphosphate synthase-like protein [Botrimarina colliarenosi]|uniref:Isoprenyl transferase n=1 Tax=Botrimarina colliarenosi TaxID=2528001 RepID=A0A5C6AEE6_9BACT|nr:isoprenyl transferase [Botrimarina colliarenosi]TWT96603.1 Decaprenyl diphosphate synthase-like protein [Botrimarina colliarenosi]
MSAETAADLPEPLADVPAERWPRHIAIIMDGNGRWAERQGLARVAGHDRGGHVVRAITRECARLAPIEHLTLYCLSSENWKRPAEELAFLMQLLEAYLVNERPIMMEDNVRVRMIGRREGIPDRVLDELDKTVSMSAGNDGLQLNLAINYGGRGELVDSARSLAYQVMAGQIDPADIDEQAIGKHLYTEGRPDPDLLIRTAGEMRISNFLLWQISYAEIWVTDRAWPEFDEATLHEAILDYAGRERRFGGLNR